MQHLDVNSKKDSFRGALLSIVEFYSITIGGYRGFGAWSRRQSGAFKSVASRRGLGGMNDGNTKKGI